MKTIIIIIFILVIASAAMAPMLPKCWAVQKGKVHIRKMLVTAYCPCHLCCGSAACGITASGYKIKPADKLLAAPPEIPFETAIFVPGYGRAKVKDRGGKIQGDRLDVYFGLHIEALKWGRQELEVTIYDN